MLTRHAWLPLLAAAFTLVATMTALAASRGAGTALACTGGGTGGPIEFLAKAESIAIVEAVVVGSDVNQAPTVTPTASASPTVPPDGTPSPDHTPVSPPSSSPPIEWGEFELRGLGVTFRVASVIAGVPPETIDHGWEQRGFIEDELRRREAGGGSLSSCELDRFLARYTKGGRYLLFFAEHPEPNADPFTTFPLDGDAVILDDPEHLRAFSGVLLMEPSTYSRYFAGVAFEEWGGPAHRHVTETRISLEMMVRAIAGLRGDPSISPPNAGSAGLKAATR